AEQKAVREIMVFLHSHGVGTARAVRIFKTYGADAIRIMTENPYRLARDVRGISFKTADAIAMKLGIEKTAMGPVPAGISYALTEAMDEGHCGLPTDELAPLAEKLLEVPGELVRTALDLELAHRPASGGAYDRRAADAACGWYAALASNRSGQGVAVDREADRICPCGKPGRRDPTRADVQDAGHDRWTGRRQDHHRQGDSAHSSREGNEAFAMCPDRPSRQAHDRSNRL